MTTEQPQQPQYEPGGGKLLAVAAALVIIALLGITFSFMSRMNAPSDAPPIKSRHLPPSAKPDAPKSAQTDPVPAGAAVVPAPTSSPAK